MSMWNIELEGFPPQWLDLAGRFETGTTEVYMRCKDEKEAQKRRFEWYAFNRKLRQAEADIPMEQHMYPSVARVSATIGQLRSGTWVLRFALRDIGATAAALEEALSMTPEEVDDIKREFPHS